MHDKYTEDIGADDEPTDELPVLSEEAILEFGGEFATVPEDSDARTEATDEHRVELPGAPDDDAEAPRRPRKRPAKGPRTQRDKAIRSLERDIAELSTRWTSVEDLLEANNAAIEALRKELAEAGLALEDSRESEKQLLTELAARDTQLSELQERLTAERRDNANLRTAVEQGKRRYAALETQLTETEHRLAEVEREAARPPEAAAPQAYAEQIQSLTAYIAGRDEQWREIEAVATERSERIAELEAELDQRIARQREIEKIARDESARADAFKAKLGEAAARLADFEHGPAGLALPPADPTAPSPESPSAPPSESAPHEVRPDDATTVLDDAHAVRDDDERLRRAVQERELLRERLEAAESELDETRADLSRLEKTLADRDRSLTAQDDRIAVLQHELAERLRALRAYQDLEPKVRRIGRAADEAARPPGGLDRRAGADASAAPQTAGRPGAVLLCLTSDPPRQYAIGKPLMTIGRATQCDIQILTQFVSREHARLVREGDGVVVEDLGSKNGVFVNSVRVDRRRLAHGDWVTIGETQFRFLNEGAA